MQIFHWFTSALFILDIEGTTDHQPPDLAGASPDLVQLGVSEVSAGGVIVYVTVTPEDLDGVQGDLGGLFRADEDDGGAVLAGDVAGVGRLGGVVQLTLADMSGILA